MCEWHSKSCRPIEYFHFQFRTILLTFSSVSNRGCHGEGCSKTGFWMQCLQKAIQQETFTEDTHWQGSWEKVGPWMFGLSEKVFLLERSDKPLESSQTTWNPIPWISAWRLQRGVDEGREGVRERVRGHHRPGVHVLLQHPGHSCKYNVSPETSLGWGEAQATYGVCSIWTGKRTKCFLRKFTKRNQDWTSQNRW